MSKETAISLKSSTLDAVETRVQELTAAGGLQLPPNYSADNALKAAWLVLQDTKDRNKKSVLESCTRNSIISSLFSMVVQGLDPNRKQCYFIAHGNELTLRRSYFGTLALAKRFGGVRDIHAEVVFKGDEFEYEIQNGIKRVTKHVQTLETLGGDILGAYAVVEFVDPERTSTTEIMTMKQIQTAWSQGGNSNPAREKFPSEMAMRSVINRALKLHINSSDDEHLNLILPHIERGEDLLLDAEHDLEADVAERANQQVIDVEPSDDGEIIDVESTANEHEDASLFGETPPF